MKYNKLIAVISFFMCFQSNAQYKAIFSALIKQANTFLQQKDYLNATSRYSEAFSLGINVSIDDRYNAAAAWAMLNIIDSSFAQFNILVKDIEFTYLDDVLSDSSFTSLHSDSRWPKVLDEIKVNIKNQNQVIELKNFSDSLVYAYGILEAQNLKAKYGRLKPNIIAAATKETLRNKQQLDKSQIDRLIAFADIEKTKSETFLNENKSKTGIITTTSGLQYKININGIGSEPVDTSLITVYYIGKTIDGNVFDSTLPPKSPITFPLKRLIMGWQEGLKLIKPGGKISLYIPSKLGYGISGSGEAIPPNAVLIFDIELVKVE